MDHQGISHPCGDNVRAMEPQVGQWGRPISGYPKYRCAARRNRLISRVGDDARWHASAVDALAGPSRTGDTLYLPLCKRAIVDSDFVDCSEKAAGQIPAPRTYRTWAFE